MVLALHRPLLRRPERRDLRRLPLHRRPRPRRSRAQRQCAHRRVRLGPRPLRRRDDHDVGVPIGGTIAALVGREVIPASGWRPMYAVAFVAVVVLLPLCWRYLPESPTWLRSRGRLDEAAAVDALHGIDTSGVPTEKPEHEGIKGILRGPWLVATVLFSLATVATLFAWYGLGTWLPKLMGSDARFDLGNPLNFLIALNVGAVIGSVVTAWAGMRFGPLRSAIGAALLAAAGLAFLLTYPSEVTPIYAALILAGVGTHGTQCLIIAAVASHYPQQTRGTSLGFVLGIGRIGAVAAPYIGGSLLDAGLGVGSNFVAFSLAAALAAVLLVVTAVVTTRPRAGANTTEPRTERVPVAAH
ncbi:MFS transporter [Knoellia locipacati]|uniref:MFS transporter n=1 Tax=Knoellia locipacati TaxID=882824 RepID=UPI00384C1B64